MKGKMKAAVLYKVKDLRVEEVEIPSISDEEVLVRVRACGICSSDLGRVMVYGTYRFPLIPGHEFSGEIAETGKKVRGFQAGERVAVVPLIPCRSCEFCQLGEYAQCISYDYLGSRSNGGFAEYVRVPARNVISLPENLDFESGAFTEPVSVALHGIRRTEVDSDGSIVIFGAGPIGIIIAQWARILGIKRIFIVDILKQKLEVARGYGFEDCINGAESDPVNIVKQKTGGGADLSIEASGSPKSFVQCVEATRNFGKVIFLGNVSGDVTFSQAQISSILRKQVTIYGTWNSNFSPGPKDDWQPSLYFMNMGLIKVIPLITHRFNIEQAKEAFELMWNKKEFFNKVMFIFD